MNTVFEDFSQNVQNVFGQSCQREEGEDLLTVTLEGNPLRLFSQDGKDLYCRGRIGDFTQALEPKKLLEDTLKANHFWQGTNGGYISVGQEDETLSLNERHDLQELCDPEALTVFLEDFLRTLQNWQTRLQTYCQTATAVQEEETRLVAEATADQQDRTPQEDR